MIGLVDLALPCRLISLKVKLGPERGVTTLEDLVAKAILAGRTSVERQAELFGLPRRLLLDVVISLWGKGYVTIDMESGEIRLSDSAHDILIGGGTLQEASAEVQDRQFLFEPITGRVLSPRQGMQHPPGGTLQVPLHHGIDESDLPQDELVRAVQAAIRQDRREGFRKSVLGVNFGNPVLRPPALLRWIPVAASVAIEPDTERAVVTLTDARNWDVRSRARVREHLAKLADAEPRHPFVQQLRGRADVRLEPPESARTLSDRFSAMVSRLDDLPSAQVAKHQKDLTELSARLEDRLAALDRARASATVVSRASGQLWAADDLVKSARTQLVIVAPTISYRALNPLLPGLRAALDSGVQLVVLWGRTLADSLQDRVRTAFDDLATRYQSEMVIPDRSARTDACLIIQDDTRALVSSHSLLEADPGKESGAVSVLVEPANEGSAPPLVVKDLLAWARGAYPYWQDGQRIRIHCTEPVDPPPVTRDQATPAIPVNIAEDSDAAARRLWAADWAEYCVTLAERMREGDAMAPVIEVVTDSEHQDYLWRAVRNAQQRLILADDDADPSLLGRLLAALWERSDAGLGMDLVCQSATAVKVFSERNGQQRGDIRLHQQHAAARLVVVDDEALIGSFSPLGDDGSRQSGSARRSQLGLRIQGQAVVTELTRSLPVAVPVGRRYPEEVARQRTRSAATAALPLLVDARRERSRGRFGAFVAARLAGLDQPWAVLNAWQAQSVPAEDLRAAAAALVRQEAYGLRAGPVSQPEVLPWVNWLLTDAWEHSRFVEAAVIAGLARDADVTPLAAACVAAAPIEHGPLGGEITEPALELSDIETAAATAGAAGALAEMMLWGSPEGKESVELLAEAFPPSWRDLASAALEFNSSASGAAVPIGAIAAEFSRWDKAGQREERWADLAERIDKLERLRNRFNFDSGVAMHAGLFDSAGVLTLIRTAARDPSARQHLAGHLPREVGQHLNALVASAGAPPIQWHRQQHFLRDITDIVRSARALTSSQLPIGAVAAAITSPACRDLAVAAAKGRDELLADANGTPYPYGLALRALLERVSPLTRWGLS